jgi:hypothetical protein
MEIDLLKKWGPTLPNGEPLSIVVPIAEGCGVMGISRSTYYAAPQDSTSSALKRESDAALRSAIENVVAEWSA